MLYVTTRNNRDAFTAQRALRENRGPDGGMYLPFHMPKFSQTEIETLAEKSFNQCVAEILNLLFNTKLTSWDIDFCIGRYPVRLETLRHRIIIAETWHNPEWNYERLVKNLVDHLCNDYAVPTDWAKIAVRIAVLFGIFGELKRAGIPAADVAAVSGDFSAPISVWYARQWGLPVGNIVCCCNENKSLWDLICHGQLRTDVLSIPTAIPDADAALPDDLERLIYECGGISEVQHYQEACRRGRMYCPNDMMLRKLRNGLYVSVVSSQRIQTTIPSVYRTHNYLLSPYPALAYAGLLDYRAKTGETRHAVVLAERSPVYDGAMVAGAIGISVEELNKYL